MGCIRPCDNPLIIDRPYSVIRDLLWLWFNINPLIDRQICWWRVWRIFSSGLARDTALGGRALRGKA